MQPFIGVTSSADAEGRPVVRDPYVRALHAVGARPVPLPFIASESEARALLADLDGIVFTGSDDLDPALWNEPRHARTVLIHPARAMTELLLARAALARRMPVLGICGGMQTLNVACGGSLHQHLPDLDATLEHQDATYATRHRVAATPGSRVCELLGPDFDVNTSHHQAVHRLGSGLVATALAPDGVIEACELQGAPFVLGVQWHPERMFDEGLQSRLFAALAHAASGADVGAAASESARARVG
jgi:putative glutamine amidotransferase